MNCMLLKKILYIFKESLRIQQNQANISELFLAEAYGCVRCTVNVEMLSEQSIANIKNGLLRARSKENLELSPRSQRRQEEDVFKPPVPYALATVEVEAIDAQRKFYDYSQ